MVNLGGTKVIKKIKAATDCSLQYVYCTVTHCSQYVFILLLLAALTPMMPITFTFHC